MTKTVLLFAAAKELAGAETVELQLDDNATVATLRQQLVEQVPALKELVARSFVALDHQFANDGASVGAAKEIGLIPPVSGG